MKGIDPADRNSARAATLRLIVALSDSHSGRPDDALRHLAAARPVIAANFSGDLSRGNSNIGHWYDWAFAHILLAEADAEAKTPVK